jgi:hypothetical protein
VKEARIAAGSITPKSMIYMVINHSHGVLAPAVVDIRMRLGIIAAKAEIV